MTNLLLVLLSGTRVRLFQALGCGALECWRPSIRSQRTLRRGVGLDLAYSYLVPVLIYPAVFPLIRVLGQMGRGFGLHGTVGHWSIAVQVALAVAVGDFV